MKTVGVLALQGDFAQHLASLQHMGVEGFEVREKADLKRVSGLILPGGESTTIAKLLKSTGLDLAVQQRVKAGMPVWGTCAGAILLAKKVDSLIPLETQLSLIDVDITRNAYGRQTESFRQRLSFAGEKFPAFFIRAPKITRLGRGVKVLVEDRGNPVCVQQKQVMISTFHSELEGENPVLKSFLMMVRD